jgi:hypothetical protein
MKSQRLRAWQGFQDSPGHLFLGEPPAVDGQVGIAAVKRETFGVQVGQGLAGTADQTPGVQVSEAGQEFLEGDFQKNKSAQEAQVLHGKLTINDTAAGGNNMVLAVQRPDETFFSGPHAQIAVLVHDLLQGAAFPGLKEEIGVQEAEMSVLCHQHPNGALTGPGHPDENEGGQF